MRPLFLVFIILANCTGILFGQDETSHSSFSIQLHLCFDGVPSSPIGSALVYLGPPIAENGFRGHRIGTTVDGSGAIEMPLSSELMEALESISENGLVEVSIVHSLYRTQKRQFIDLNMVQNGLPFLICAEYLPKLRAAPAEFTPRDLPFGYIYQSTVQGQPLVSTSCRNSCAQTYCPELIAARCEPCHASCSEPAIVITENLNVSCDQ